MTEQAFDRDPDTHLRAVGTSILAGRVVPFLGAGANLCGAGKEVWDIDSPRLPNSLELIEHIATTLPYPPDKIPDLKTNLARVSQYADLIYGRGRLDVELRPVFSGEISPTPLHTFLATLPNRYRQARRPKTDRLAHEFKKHLLIVTTNYDDVMATAFREAGEDFHEITYRSKDNVPAFEHKAPNGVSTTIRNGTTYDRLDDDDHPIILKVHGSVEGDNFVITEDDYIKYLAHGDIAQALPRSLNAQLNQSHFLFLGYGLHDWNLRAFLYRIRRDQRDQNFASWAVMNKSSEFEELYWKKKEVAILRMELDEYVLQLEAFFSGESQINLTK